MLFLAVIAVLFQLPLPARETTPLSPSPSLPESLTPMNKSALQMRCKKWYERSTRTFKICCATPLHQVFVVVQPRPALQLPAGTPHELLLWLLLGKKFQCTAVQVYCDVDRVCSCSNTRGWARVANLDMRNPSQQCPGELTSSEPRRLCGRGSLGAGCVSAVYSTYGISSAMSVGE